MNQSIKKERFGRYLILDHLVDGGMAKICRARFLGEQVDKIVAIKMIQPQYSKDEAFKSMFMDEIKVTFGLIHPNVVQTYDYGMHQDQLYVAMEFCDGRNLKEFLEKLKERKFVFPVEVTTYIISQACRGLHYAHTFRDKLTGVESNIIHRDISPHNIMLTYDGNVKIIDFGIAKSKKNSDSTQAGTIKGKLSYLAPEYLEGQELDGRYDQFALGITMWEMLCSQKLFKDNNDLAVLKKIQECKVPIPSSINPHVPKELDEIVIKALSKNREDRFKDMDAMNRALLKFLYAKYPDFNSSDLSYFAQELFREEIKNDREKMFEYGKIDLKKYYDEFKKEQEEKHTEKGVDKTTPGIKKVQTIDFGFSENGQNATLTKSRSRKGTSESDLDGGPKLEVKTAGPGKNTKINQTGIHNMNKPAYAQTQTGFKNNTGPGHKLNSITSDEYEDDAREKSSKFKIYVASAALLIGAISSYIYFTSSHRKLELQEMADNRISENLDNPAVADTLKHVKDGRELASKSMDEFGKITLSHFDIKTMRVFVNGKEANIDSIFKTISIPLNTDFILRVQIEHKKDFIYKSKLTNTSAVEVEIQQTEMRYGFLSAKNNCEAGEITYSIFDEERREVIPLKEDQLIKLPMQFDETKKTYTEMSHDIYYKKNGRDTPVKITVKVTHEDQVIDFCELTAKIVL